MFLSPGYGEEETTMQRSPRVMVLCFLVLVMSGSASAQYAGFSGEVTDPQKAVVPNAEVRVVNQQTAVERKAKTNGSGIYLVPYLVPGTYRIFVQAPGFETAVSEEITASVGAVDYKQFSTQPRCSGGTCDCE